MASREEGRAGPSPSTVAWLLRWPLYLTVLWFIIPWCWDVWWPLELFCHFGVQLVGVLSVFAILSLWVRDWWRLVGVLLMWAMAFSRVVSPPDQLALTAASAPVQELSIISYNLSRYNEEADALEALAEAQQVDLMVFLEVTPRWEALLEPRLKGWPHRVLDVYQSAFGIGIFSRYPLTIIHQGPLLDDGAPVAVVDLELPRGPLRLVGIHAHAPISEAWRRFRDAEFEVLAARAVSTPLPMVLCGDFNLTPHSPVFDRLMRKSGLRDARAPHEWAPTWPTQLGWLGISIDHCLVSDTIVSRASEVLAGTGSDHAPVRVDLAIPISVWEGP